MAPQPMHPSGERAVAHLAAIVESSSDAIISKTLDGIVLTWNAGAERLYGYTAAEAIDQPMTILLPEDRPDEELEILERIKRGERVEHYETVRRRKDGTRIQVSLTISPIRDRDGCIAAASHIARDITDRKQSEDQLRESENKLRAYLESASQGIVAVGASGRIELVNAKTEELFGYTRAELLGRTLEMLLPKRYHEAHTRHRAQFFSNPRQRPMGAGLDLAGLRKNCTEFPVEIALSFTLTKEGPLAIAFINDITERKKLEAQLRQTQKLESLGVLAGGVAHDFNNLLTGILGNASLALETLPANNPARGMLRDIVSASEHAAHLTRQLLAYAGKGRFVVEPVNLSELVREISSLIQTSVPKTVQLRLELQDNLPPVEADTGQLQQLIMNLVINGAEAIGPERNGTVLVTTSVQDVDELYVRSTFPSTPIALGRYVTLEVHDTGCGMDEETISRIFDPFFTTKFTGRGLGLAAVQGIVRGHKGGMKVYSQPGRGTTFKVLLPACEQAPLAVMRPSAAELAATILVIDDEPIVRRAAKAMLERYGHTVVLAENGKEATKLFHVLAGKVNLVLLDMTMPIMSGEETLSALQSVQPDVKVVLSSGYNQVEAVQRFTGKGLAGFIQKPYTASDLAKVIKSVLESE